MFSRTILAESSAQSNDASDWSDNPYITTIQEAEKYFKMACTNAALLPNRKVFNSVLEMEKMASKRKVVDVDLANFQGEMYNKLLAEFGPEIYIQILNWDHTNGLRLCREDFEYVIKTFVSFSKKREATEQSLTYTDDEGKERQNPKIRAETPTEFEEAEERIDAERALMTADGKGLAGLAAKLGIVGNNPDAIKFRKYMSEITDVRMIADDKLREEQLLEVLSWLDDDNDPDFLSKPILRNIIIGHLTGTNLTIQQRKEIDRTKKRFESYRQMEDGPEKNREFKALNTYYGQLRKAKDFIVSKQGTQYYEQMLNATGKEGKFIANAQSMLSDKGTLFKRAEQKRSLVKNVEAYDAALETFRSIRDSLFAMNSEYPGYEANIKSLINLIQVWLGQTNQYNGIVIPSDPDARRVFLTAARTDIINFVNNYESDQAFRDYIAERENKATYIQTSQRKDKVLTSTELARFKNIPDDMKNISDLPEMARLLYNKFSDDLPALENALNNEKFMSDALLNYGQDFIYNLQKLYNSMTEPSIGNISRARSFDRLDKMLSLLNDPTFAKKVTDEAKAAVDKGNRSKYREKLVNDLLQDDKTKYQIFAARRAQKWIKYFSEGKEISDTERRAALREIAKVVQDFRWQVNITNSVYKFDFSNRPIPADVDIDIAAERDAYEAANTEYSSILSEYDKTEKLIKDLSEDDWLSKLPRYLDSEDKELRDAIVKYLRINELNTNKAELAKKQAEKYAEKIVTLEKQLEAAKLKLANAKAVYDSYGKNDPAFDKAKRIQKEIDRLDAFFKDVEGNLIKNGLSAERAYTEAREQNKGRWAALRTAREQLAKLGISDFSGAKILAGIRSAESEINNIKKEIKDTQLARDEDLIINYTEDENVLADAANKKSIEKRNQLLSEAKKNVGFLKTKRDLAEAKYRKASAKYKKAESEYNTEKDVYGKKQDEQTGKYTAIKISDSTKTRDKRRIDAYRASYLESEMTAIRNLLSTLKNTDIFVDKEGRLTISTSSGAARRYEEIGKRLKEHFGSEYEEFLAKDGDKPITSEQVSKKVSLSELPSRQLRYKITAALQIAYRNFMDDPNTDRSRDRFKSDAMLALTDKGGVNAIIPGNKTPKTVSIYVPEKYRTPLEKGGTNFTKVDINARLKNLFDAQLVERSKAAAEELADIELYSGKLREIENAAREIISNTKSLGDNLRRIRIQREKYEASRRKVDTVKEADDFHTKMYKNAVYLGDGKFTSTFMTEQSEVAVPGKQYKQVIESPDYGRSNENYTHYIKYGIFDEEVTYTFTVDLSNLSATSESPQALNYIPNAEYDKFMLEHISKGIESGELKLDRESDTVLDAETEQTVLFDYSELAEGISIEPSEDNTMPEESDFSGDLPDEEDFTDGSVSKSVSRFIEDIDFYIPEFEDTPPKVKEPKGSWSSETNSDSLNSGLSENTNTILSYIPRKWESDGTFASKEFLEDNNAYLTKFINDAKEMEAFVSKIESNPSIPIDSPQEAIIFALLNKVSNLGKAVTGDNELTYRANALITKLKARGARTLGMVKGYGATPVEQLISICSKSLNLNADELQLLKDCATVQSNAIAVGNYTRANEAMTAVMEVIRKHKSELPVSMNIFAPNLTPEERTTRWHNIAEHVTNWRYFAMLGSPTTFFTKNIASNVIATGMDTSAELIAAAIDKIRPGSIKLSKDYSFNATEFESIITGKELKQLSESDVSSIVEKTITNADDRKQINIAKLTSKLNSYIKTRYNAQKSMPSASQVASQANSWLRSTFYQYRMNKAATAESKAIVQEQLVDNGLLAGLMDDTVAKYDRGFDVKIGKLRSLVLNEETSLDELSEANAAILADAARKDTPFGENNIFSKGLNAYYRLIFRTMELGDKKFIEPKIKRTLARLVASNMTSAEIAALRNGDAGARSKFNDLISYSVDDAMKTYFRGNSEFQQKIMRLFNGHPIAQIIFGTIMPFPRMALNSMNAALSYSPAGFLKALYISRNSQDSFTRLKVNKELGKAATGSIMLAAGAVLAAIGWLDFDDDDEYAGLQLVIAGKVKIALNDLMPTMSPLVIGATFTNSLTEGVWSAAYASGNALLDATLLGEAIEIFGGNKEAGDVVVNTFTSFVNQFVPSLFRHMARTIDPTKKQYSKNKGLRIIQRIAAALPGASLLVPSKVNPYTGSAIYQNAESSKTWAHILSFINAFSPAKVTLDSESLIEAESKNVGAATTGPAKTYTINGVEYIIPDELYKDYQVLRAKLYNQYASEVIHTNSYKNMSIEKKKAKLKQLQNKATEEARKQLNIGK